VTRILHCAFVAVLGVTAACGSPTLDGAAIVPAGREPAGDVVAVYEPRQCVDGNGRAATPRSARLFLVDRGGSDFVLVEARPGYDSLIVDNRFAVEGYNVFQASLEASVPPILLDYRITPDTSAGKMAVARIWQRAERLSGFRAYFSQAVLACRLERL